MTEQWIEGQLPRLMRQAVQVEYKHGRREISSCPACGNYPSGGEIVRYRILPPEIKRAYANGVARNGVYGERLKSKCCNADMVMVGKMPTCLHCWQSAWRKTE